MRLIEEIGFVSRALHGVADVLSRDAILRIRHAPRVQELCISEQMLIEIAAVLEQASKLPAVERHVTGPMRRRLLRLAND